VQQVQAEARKQAHLVSTLTQPQGRVQRCYILHHISLYLFQPSPNLKAGCNARALRAGAALIDAPVCADRYLHLLKSILKSIAKCDYC